MLVVNTLCGARAACEIVSVLAGVERSQTQCEHCQQRCVQNTLCCEAVLSAAAVRRKCREQLSTTEERPRGWLWLCDACCTQHMCACDRVSGAN